MSAEPTLSKFAHTPGPWRINKYGSVGAGATGIQPIIAEIQPFYGPDLIYGNHEANARLIAAAPDMRKAVDALGCVQAYVQNVSANGAAVTLHFHSKAEADTFVEDALFFALKNRAAEPPPQTSPPKGT